MSKEFHGMSAPGDPGVVMKLEPCEKRPPRGGWVTTPFIFGCEASERLAGTGAYMNLITFLTDEMHMNNLSAATLLNTFTSLGTVTALTGAFVADAYLGRFRTIALGSWINLSGMVALTMVVLSHKLHPLPCGTEQANARVCQKASSLQVGILYLALSLMAAGSGGIRPCVAPFGASQFDQSHPEEKKQLKHYFNWYYFSVTFASLLAVTLIVYIQDNVGWALGFGIPTIVFMLSIIVFFGGTGLYRYSHPRGSAFTRMPQVFVAALRKRNVTVPDDPSKLYLNITEGSTKNVDDSGQELLKKPTTDDFDANSTFRRDQSLEEATKWTTFDCRNSNQDGPPAVIIAPSCDEKDEVEPQSRLEQEKHNPSVADPANPRQIANVDLRTKVAKVVNPQQIVEVSDVAEKNVDFRHGVATVASPHQMVDIERSNNADRADKNIDLKGKVVKVQDEVDEAKYDHVLLRHTDQFRFLDKAAIETPLDWKKVVGKDGQIMKSANPWRLCSLQHVEELKCLLRLAPMMATLIPLHMATAQGNTYVIQQAKTMDRHLGKHFVVPAASMATISTATVLLWIPFFDKKVVPFLRNHTGQQRAITFLEKIGIGTALQILVELVKALVERKRRDAAVQFGLVNRPHDIIPISVFWLVPQFVLGGLAESFLMVGHLEFFYFMLPEHMTSTGSALIMAAHAIGASLSTILLHSTQQVTERGAHPGWLDDNINKAHLDYFYGLLTVWLVLNFVVFLVVAQWYKRHKHQNQMMLNNSDLYCKGQSLLGE